MPLTRLKCDEIKEGVIFSAPVFFDDGVNMFLAARQPAKHYHVAALVRWDVPFLVTAGHKLEESANASASKAEEEEIISLEEFDSVDSVEELGGDDVLEEI